MPSKAQQRKAAEKQRYAQNMEKKKEERKIRYRQNIEKEKLYSQEYNKNNAQYRNLHERKKYINDIEGKKKEASRKSYLVNPNKKKEASRIASCKSYLMNPNKKKEASRKMYYKRCNQKCLASRQYYYKNKNLISVRRKHQRFLHIGLPVLKKYQVLSNLKKCISGNRILASKLKKSWERSLKVPNIGQSENKAYSSKTVCAKKVILKSSFTHKLLKQKKVISKQVKRRRKCLLKNPSVLQKQKVLRNLKKTISHSRILKSRLQRLYANCDGTVDLSKKGKSINKAIL